MGQELAIWSVCDAGGSLLHPGTRGWCGSCRRDDPSELKSLSLEHLKAVKRPEEV